MQNLPDIIDYKLKILFIGFNPGLKSAQVGHHYANKSNGFWKLLYESGLTPFKLVPEDDAKLLDFGYGSTNIVDRPTRSASELKSSEFITGAINLKKQLEIYKPQVACYTGIGVYKAFSGKKDVVCGIQEDNSVNEVIDYVCSSPSGLNRMPYGEQLKCFRVLKKLIDSL